MSDPNLPPGYIEETSPVTEEIFEILAQRTQEDEEDFSGASDKLGSAPDR